MPRELGEGELQDRQGAVGAEALQDKGPGAESRLAAAARWYMGKSQLFLRLQRKKESGAAVINKRLCLYLDGQFGAVLKDWHNARQQRLERQPGVRVRRRLGTPRRLVRSSCPRRGAA